MKGANEVNRLYFQQAVLLCLLKALYYAGICSCASCIMPRPNFHMMLHAYFLLYYVCHSTHKVNGQW